MKKIFFLCLVALLCIRGSVWSQYKNETCQYKDWTREFVNLADNLARFIDDTKVSVTDKDWESFTAALKNGEGEKAFDHLGKLSESTKTTLDNLGSQLAAHKQKLYETLSSGGKISEAEVKEIINRDIICYFSDKKENSLQKLVAAAGRLAPPEIGTLPDGNPCAVSLGACLSVASENHSSGLNNCISAGIGGSGLFGWLGGIFTGGACLINVENRYNNAKINCAKAFDVCMKD